MNTPVDLGWQKWVKSVQCIYGGVVFSNKRCYGVESQNQSDILQFFHKEIYKVTQQQIQKLSSI